MKGFIINTLTVSFGSLVGLYLGKKIKEDIKNSVFNALGLITIFLGIKMALQGKDAIVMVLSLVFGALIGSAIQLEDKVSIFFDNLKHRYVSQKGGVEGFIVASTLFCVGSMTIIGSIKDGVYNDGTLIKTKSIMDGFASILLSARYGPSVIFSAVSVFLIQGALTISSKFLPAFSQEFMFNLDGVGGIIVLSIGLNLLNLTNIKTLDLLPSLIFLPILLWLR